MFTNTSMKLKQRIYSLNPLAVFYYFALTVVIVRGSIFISLLFDSPPAIFINGWHIHHFVFGFILFVLTLDATKHKEIPRFILEMGYGISLGLMFDEFTYWALGRFDYWSHLNLVAAAGIAVIAGIISQFNHKMFRIKILHNRFLTHHRYSFRKHVIIPWASFVCLLVILYRFNG